MKHLKTTIGAATMMALTACAAYAETVTISTYYPSPFGSYVNLDSTGATNLATAGGMVGVGTSAPGGTGAKIDIRGGAIASEGQSVLNLSGGTNLMIGDLAAGDGMISNLMFRTSDTERIRVDNAGNVGIATTAPTQRLDVVGNIRAQGRIIMQDGGGASGTVQMDCDGASCYATYAP